MTTTLFSEIQRLFERTYASVGVNLEECLIDRHRCGQLSAMAGAQAAELSMLARTFLRTADGNLRVGIYYSNWLIEQLERHDPRAGVSDENIGALIAFVEEINHALHAALRFQKGEAPVNNEAYARNLELQAKVDTYLVLLVFVAFFRKPGPVTRADRKWIRFHLFESKHPGRGRNLRARYAETTLLAKRYTTFLESLAATRRIEEIRIFHALDYDAKRHRILGGSP
jgi:phosphatidylglycerophosphatase A